MTRLRQQDSVLPINNLQLSVLLAVKKTCPGNMDGIASVTRMKSRHASDSQPWQSWTDTRETKKESNSPDAKLHHHTTPGDIAPLFLIGSTEYCAFRAELRETDIH